MSTSFYRDKARRFREIFSSEAYRNRTHPDNAQAKEELLRIQKELHEAGYKGIRDKRLTGDLPLSAK